MKNSEITPRQFIEERCIAAGLNIDSPAVQHLIDIIISDHERYVYVMDSLVQYLSPSPVSDLLDRLYK